MTSLDAVDTQLLAIVSGAAPATIAEVVAVMNAIDQVLPKGDGLKWFNLLYLQVTQHIDLQPPAGGWEDAAYLTRLDIVFAGLYFAAVASWLSGNGSTPSSWAALFEARTRPHIDRIQFALAGMNAHINHDLALALLQTDAEMNMQPGKQSAEHDDYERVNGILAQVLPQALTFLAADCLGEAAQDTGRIGQLLAIWDVGVARDAAWDFADHLRSLPEAAKPLARLAQDRLTGVIGRSLLLPLA
jgi:hypothetical protein